MSVRKYPGKQYCGDLGIYKDKTLKGCEGELDSSGVGQRPVAGSYEHSNGPSDTIRGKSCLDYLNRFQLYRKDYSAELGYDYISDL
jgi:hypothetical protein